MKTRSVEEKHYFANRSEAFTKVDSMMLDHQIHRVWFTDRYWQKDDPKRFEVIIQWEED